MTQNGGLIISTTKSTGNTVLRSASVVGSDRPLGFGPLTARRRCSSKSSPTASSKPATPSNQPTNKKISNMHAASFDCAPLRELTRHRRTLHRHSHPPRSRAGPSATSSPSTPCSSCEGEGDLLAAMVMLAGGYVADDMADAGW